MNSFAVAKFVDGDFWNNRRNMHENQGKMEMGATILIYVPRKGKHLNSVMIKQGGVELLT